MATETGSYPRHHLPFVTVEVKGVRDRTAAIEWIAANQLGRRNLNASQKAAFGAELEEQLAVEARQAEFAPSQSGRGTPSRPPPGGDHGGRDHLLGWEGGCGRQHPRSRRPSRVPLSSAARRGSARHPDGESSGIRARVFAGEDWTDKQAASLLTIAQLFLRLHSEDTHFEERPSIEALRYALTLAPTGRPHPAHSLPGHP